MKSIIILIFLIALAGETLHKTFLGYNFCYNESIDAHHTVVKAEALDIDLNLLPESWYREYVQARSKRTHVGLGHCTVLEVLRTHLVTRFAIRFADLEDWQVLVTIASFMTVLLFLHRPVVQERALVVR